MAEKYDVLIIGSGPGGYVAAIKCAQLGLKTACIEKGALGGTCLNIGCIPSKSLLQSSELYDKIKRESQDHGIESGELRLNFPTMQQRKSRVVSEFTGGIAMLFKKNKVTHIQGTARFVDATTVEVNGEHLQADALVIATGSAPATLPFLPLDEQDIVSSTGALAFDTVPEKLLLVGAGIIGVELGSVYSRLGSEVVVCEYLDTICPGLDTALSKELKRQLEKQGMSFHLGTKIVGMEKKEGRYLLSTEQGTTFEGDKILVAVGRKPYTEGLALENAGITLDDRGMIPVNGAFQTAVANIYAIGDVIDGPMLAHKASEEGAALAEHLAGKSASLEYITIPSVVYTHPEVASVGFTEEEAKAASLEYSVGKFPFKANSRAKCSGEEVGFVKLLAEKTTGRLLGAHIIGAHAGELIQQAAIALQKRATVYDIAHTSHAHPTLSEAMKEAALAAFFKPIHA